MSKQLTQQRFNVLLDGPTVGVLDEIQEGTSLRSRAAVFDLAVNILYWVLDQKRKGMDIGRYDPRTSKFDELLIPITFYAPAEKLTVTPSQAAAPGNEAPLYQSSGAATREALARSM